jgi:hypothetical protein
VALALMRDRPGRVGATLTQVTIQVRSWATGPVVGFMQCKERVGRAARVEKESGPSRLVSEKMAHGRFLFLKTFSILQTLFPIQNSFEFKPNLNFE